jgi:hypothetical protein
MDISPLSMKGRKIYDRHEWPLGKEDLFLTPTALIRALAVTQAPAVTRTPVTHAPAVTRSSGFLVSFKEHPCEC